MAQIINWNKLREVGLLDRLTPFCTKIFVGNEITFTYKGWSNLFVIQERVYKELCLECFSTVVFQENIDNPNFPPALVFCLGGEYMECSLVEFAWRIGLYEAHETMNPIFLYILTGSFTGIFWGYVRV